MNRSRGSKRETTPAAETQPAIAVAEQPQLEWVRFSRAHVHDRVQRVSGERIWVTPGAAALLVDRLGVATRVTA